MTTIYVIPNIAPGLLYYVCDSQATIDDRPTDPSTGEYVIPLDQCVVGTQTEADAILAANQQTLLTQNASLFTVNLQTVVEGGIRWTVVDLSTQPPNADNQYFLLDPTTGSYTEAIGLDAAKALLAQIQQTYLIFNNMTVYQTLTSWTQWKTN